MLIVSFPIDRALLYSAYPRPFDPVSILSLWCSFPLLPGLSLLLRRDPWLEYQCRHSASSWDNHWRFHWHSGDYNLQPSILQTPLLYFWWKFHSRSSVTTNDLWRSAHPHWNILVCMDSTTKYPVAESPLCGSFNRMWYVLGLYSGVYLHCGLLYNNGKQCNGYQRVDAQHIRGCISSLCHSDVWEAWCPPFHNNSGCRDCLSNPSSCVLLVLGWSHPSTVLCQSIIRVE